MTFAPSTMRTASTNGTAPASTHSSQRRIGLPRRRARARPSTIVSSTGRISASTISLTAHTGMTLLSQIR